MTIHRDLLSRASGTHYEVQLNPSPAVLEYSLRRAVADPVPPARQRTGRRSCSSECARNVLPLLPVLTVENEEDFPSWHAYIRVVYKQRLRGSMTIDLNTFSLFYRNKVCQLVARTHALCQTERSHQPLAFRLLGILPTRCLPFATLYV